MAKCYLTGVEIPVESAYVLDRGAAQRALRSLKQRVAAVERLIAQLGPKDEVEAYGPNGPRKRKGQRRLVCPTVAAALAASYPEARVFVSWPEFAERRPVFPEFRTKPAGRGTKTAGVTVTAEANHGGSC
jgi:hypothetical protein